jgi:hypothetical protein
MSSLTSNIGVLMSMSQTITDYYDMALSVPQLASDFPPTPPLSDYSESRPLSPDLNTDECAPFLTIHIESKEQHKRSNSGLRNRTRDLSGLYSIQQISCSACS